MWNGDLVAVKTFKYTSKDFERETQSFRQIRHDNIITIIQQCRAPLSIIMEYSSDGSLHHLLHTNPNIKYSWSHALDWAWQCAKVSRGMWGDFERGDWGVFE